MSDEENIPRMLEFMFGEAAGVARRTASKRLLRWCQAMEDWLDERKRNCHKTTHKTSIIAWRRLLSQCSKAPWELGPKDLEAHIKRMRGQGYKPSSIELELSNLSSFYQWCGQEGVDPQCDPGFNPLRGVKRPKVKHYSKSRVLSRQEAAALLSILKSDPSILSKRDYAFFLARLKLGVKLGHLRKLKWGQIERDGARAWVRWGPGEERQLLPQEVWEAILDYMEAAGRLETMESNQEEAKYIFAPLRDPLVRGASGSAEDWHEGRPLTTDHIKKILNTFGRLAGIPEEKLTLSTLRYTALSIRREAGDSLEEIQTFMNKSGELRHTQDYLRAVPTLPREAAHPADTEHVEGGAEEEREGPSPPERAPHRYQQWEQMTHGFFAQSQPPEEVAEILAQDIQGMEEEIMGLRALRRRLMRMEGQAEHSGNLRLLEAQSMAAERIKDLVEAEKRLGKKHEGEPWVEDMLRAAQAGAIQLGYEADMEEFKRQILGDDPGLAIDSRLLTEEIASVRVTLRRGFEIAMESEDPEEVARITLYTCRSCMRLARLLTAEGAEDDRLGEAVWELFERAHAQVVEELGLK